MHWPALRRHLDDGVGFGGLWRCYRWFVLFSGKTAVPARRHSGQPAAGGAENSGRGGARVHRGRAWRQAVGASAQIAQPQGRGVLFAREQR